MILRPTIRTVALRADIAAVTDAYSECEFFSDEFKAEIVTSTYRPNAVVNLKEKLGVCLLNWWDFIVNEVPERLNDDPAELRKDIMAELRKYEIEMKTGNKFATHQNNEDVPESLRDEWMRFVRLKYRVYLARYESDMKCFLSDVYDTVSSHENFADYVHMMETLGLRLSSEEQSDTMSRF